MALEKGASCTPINLGSGKGVSIREIVETIRSCFDDPPEVEWDTSKPSGEPIRLMDTTRAATILGFTPQTSMRQGIRETVA